MYAVGVGFVHTGGFSMPIGCLCQKILYAVWACPAREAKRTSARLLDKVAGQAFDDIDLGIS